MKILVNGFSKPPQLDDFYAKVKSSIAYPGAEAIMPSAEVPTEITWPDERVLISIAPPEVGFKVWFLDLELRTPQLYKVTLWISKEELSRSGTIEVTVANHPDLGQIGRLIKDFLDPTSAQNEQGEPATPRGFIRKDNHHEDIDPSVSQFRFPILPVPSVVAGTEKTIDYFTFRLIGSRNENTIVDEFGTAATRPTFLDLEKQTLKDASSATDWLVWPLDLADFDRPTLVETLDLIENSLVEIQIKEVPARGPSPSPSTYFRNGPFQFLVRYPFEARDYAISVYPIGQAEFGFETTVYLTSDEADKKLPTYRPIRRLGSPIETSAEALCAEIKQAFEPPKLSDTSKTDHQKGGYRVHTKSIANSELQIKIDRPIQDDEAQMVSVDVSIPMPVGNGIATVTLRIENYKRPDYSQANCRVVALDMGSLHSIVAIQKAGAIDFVQSPFAALSDHETAAQEFHTDPFVDPHPIVGVDDPSGVGTRAPIRNATLANFDRNVSSLDRLHLDIKHGFLFSQRVDAQDFETWLTTLLQESVKQSDEDTQVLLSYPLHVQSETAKTLQKIVERTAAKLRSGTEKLVLSAILVPEPLAVAAAGILRSGANTPAHIMAVDIGKRSTDIAIVQWERKAQDDNARPRPDLVVTNSVSLPIGGQVFDFFIMRAVIEILEQIPEEALPIGCTRNCIATLFPFEEALLEGEFPRTDLGKVVPNPGETAAARAHMRFRLQHAVQLAKHDRSGFRLVLRSEDTTPNFAVEAFCEAVDHIQRRADGAWVLTIPWSDIEQTKAFSILKTAYEILLQSAVPSGGTKPSSLFVLGRSSQLPFLSSILSSFAKRNNLQATGLPFDDDIAERASKTLMVEGMFHIAENIDNIGYRGCMSGYAVVVVGQKILRVIAAPRDRSEIELKDLPTGGQVRLAQGTAGLAQLADVLLKDAPGSASQALLADCLGLSAELAKAPGDRLKKSGIDIDNQNTVASIDFSFVGASNNLQLTRRSRGAIEKRVTLRLSKFNLHLGLPT